MIGRLITAWRHVDEIAELRDRAVIDAETISALRLNIALAVARNDQADVLLRDIADGLRSHATLGGDKPCPLCAVIDRIDHHRTTTTKETR